MKNSYVFWTLDRALERSTGTPHFTKTLPACAMNTTPKQQRYAILALTAIGGSLAAGRLSSVEVEEDDDLCLFLGLPHNLEEEVAVVEREANHLLDASDDVFVANPARFC